MTRYSARLTPLFVKEPLFRTTFALFVSAIAFNLFVIYLLPVQSGRLTFVVVQTSNLLLVLGMWYLHLLNEN